MPTPIGHSLAGYAAAKLTRVQLGANEKRLFLAAAAFGVLPDVLGLLTETFRAESQHGVSHSIVALALVSLAAAGLARGVGWRFWPVLLFVGAAYGSHLVADLLRPALGPTSGEQLLWPLPGRYGISVNILPHVPGWAGMPGLGTWLRGMSALVLREVVVLAPIAVACHYIRPAVASKPMEEGDRAPTDRAAA